MRSPLAVCLWLALALPLAARARPAVLLVPFEGKAGKECTKVFAALAAPRVEIRVHEGPPPPHTWRALARWLQGLGEDAPAWVVLGDARGKDVVLEAYDPRGPKLVALEHAATGPRCRLAAADRARVAHFIGRLQTPEPGAPSAPEVLPPLLVATASTATVAAGSTVAAVAPETTWRPRPRPRPERDPEEPSVAFAVLRPAHRVKLGVELDLGGRSLGFRLVRSAGLASYELPIGVLLGLSLQAYPLLGLSDLLAPLTVGAELRRAMALRSSEVDGTLRDTLWAEGALWLGYGFEARGLELILTPSLGYGRSVFQVKDTRAVPAVDHQSVHFGLRGEIGLRPGLAAFGEAKVLAVLSSGAIFGGAWFPRGNAFGVSLQAGASIRLDRALGVSLSGVYEGYSLSLQPDAAGPRVAEGALDARLSLRAAIAWAD